MALITDPDSLTGTELTVTDATKLIKLNVAGNLSTDGVTLKCLYSKLKELWKTDANHIKYPFPMQPITDEQFELINGWNFDNTDATTSHKTCNLIRNGGWALKDAAGVSQEEWAGIVTLGTLGGSDQVYYQQETAGVATNIALTGAVNQAVKVYGDASHEDFDYRSYFKLFVREYQKLYASAQLSDIGVIAMTYQVYRFPLSNAADLKITHNDAAMSGAPYSGMHLTWYAAPQSETIGGSSYPFHVVIDGNGARLSEVYEWIQYKLRQDTDIDEGSGTKTGKTAADLLRYVGDTLYTIEQAEGGVFISNFSALDVNSVYFADDDWASSSDNRYFPYVASLILQFGDTLQADDDAIYHVYFTNDDTGNNAGADFGTASAITVNDGEGTPAPMSGSISNEASISKTFDYDGNVQRGAGSAATDAPITVVAIGLNSAQYVKATGTIQRSKSNVVSLVAPLERNYANPV